MTERPSKLREAGFAFAGITAINGVLTDSWNKMFGTRFVKDTHIKYELPNIYRGSELQVNHKLALHLPVYAVCREVLLFHRRREGSRVHKKDRPIQQGFEIITESLIEECKAAGLSLNEELSKVYYGLAVFGIL